jgi:DNA polymerase III subunit beta
MKITVLQENLKSALTNLQKAIPSKPQLPILSSIYLKAENNRLTLSATDLFLGIKSTIPAKIDVEGSCVIPGDIFKNLIFSFSVGDISLEQKEKNIIVKYEKSKSSLPFQSGDDYPQFPEVKGDEFSLEKTLLEKIDKYVTFAAAQDQTRPILTSLLFSFKEDGMELAATDGYRLATFTHKSEIININRDLLIPVKALSEVFRMMNQTESETIAFKVSEELKQVLFVVDGVEIYVRLIEGEYPPYKKIIPDDFKYAINLDLGELTTQVKRAFLFAKQSSNIVRLSLSENKLTVKATSPSTGEYIGEIEIKYSGEEQEIAFNASYLLDFLNTQKEGDVVFKINESLKPVAFYLPNEKDLLYVVMPFRTN